MVWRASTVMSAFDPLQTLAECLLSTQSRHKRDGLSWVSLWVLGLGSSLEMRSKSVRLNPEASVGNSAANLGTACRLDRPYAEAFRRSRRTARTCGAMPSKGRDVSRRQRGCIVPKDGCRI